jgi:hypothetical protein
MAPKKRRNQGTAPWSTKQPRAVPKAPRTRTVIVVGFKSIRCVSYKTKRITAVGSDVANAWRKREQRLEENWRLFSIENDMYFRTFRRGGLEPHVSGQNLTARTMHADTFAVYYWCPAKQRTANQKLHCLI